MTKRWFDDREDRFGVPFPEPLSLADIQSLQSIESQW
jgi:hypothetical protein